MRRPERGRGNIADDGDCYDERLPRFVVSRHEVLLCFSFTLSRVMHDGGVIIAAVVSHNLIFGKL